MLSIAEQAEAANHVIDLSTAAFRTEPRRPDCCVSCARADRWVRGMGGYASPRFTALCREARETAGERDQWRYLDLAMEADAEHDATAGEHLAAAAIELSSAQSARQARERAEAAAGAALQRVTQVKLAADQLLSHPRLASDPDLGSGPGMGSAEVDLELRAAMGLARRSPTAYEAMLPAASELARRIGLR
jgi:hypothetical protein